MTAIPEEFKNLPRVDFFLDNGDDLFSLLIDLNTVSDNDLATIIADEIAASGIFHCVKYTYFSIRREGDRVYIWPLCEHKKRITLFASE
jgi:hypothetical protein